MNRTNRLEWTIIKKQMWTAQHSDGTYLLARTKPQLMSKINEYDKAQ